MAFLSVLWMVLKQVWNNRRLEANLLAALIIAVAVIASVPIYTDGALQYLLMEKWEAAATSRDIAPGSLMLWRIGDLKSSDAKEARSADFLKVSQFVEDEMASKSLLPVVRFQRVAKLDNYVLAMTDNNVAKYGRITNLTNYYDMIDVVQGRLPETTDPNDVIEAMVTTQCFDTFEFEINGEYKLNYVIPKDPANGRPRDEEHPLKVKIVGVFKSKDEYYRSPEWAIMTTVDEQLFVTDDTFLKLLDMPGARVNWLAWYWLVDHRGLRVHQAEDYRSMLINLETQANQIMSGISWSRSPVTILQSFSKQADVLRILMFALSVPILGMVFYYIMLAAQLMINRRRTEVSMLQSRGAGRLQICASYLIEWGMLGAVAVLVGPYLGLFLAQVMGASKGFLSFVGRKPLPAQLFADPYRYALTALAVALACVMVLVFSAAGQSIVNYKQSISRKHQMPIWQKIPVDLLMIGFAYYGYRLLVRQASTGTLDSGIILDPSLFLFPAIMILGVGLLILRVFPLIVWALDRVTSSWSGIAWNMTLKQLYRSPEQYNPLILLIILTLALGIYSSSTARTMDRNFEDRLSYQFGADVVLQEQWQEPQLGGLDIEAEEAASADSSESRMYEPPFYIHQQLPGVQSAARVLKVSAYSSTGRTGTIDLMGLDPYEFVDTAWCRPGLLDYDIIDYLNLLIARPQGVLLDEFTAAKAQLKPGDWISIEIRGVTTLDLPILAIVRYWPTLYANKRPFAVANIDYLQSVMPIQPYQVWLKLEPGATLQPIVDTLRANRIFVEKVQDLRAELLSGVRDPQRMGLYGMLSTGFLVASLITIMGFLLYTFLSLKGRMLQFGVLRAIGLRVRQLTLMLVYEHLLSVGLAVLVGTILGDRVSSLFLPLLRLSTDSNTNTPPFLVVFDWTDKLRIYAVLGGALLIGLIGLQVVIARLRIHQAVKLGEDQ